MKFPIYDNLYNCSWIAFQNKKNSHIPRICMFCSLNDQGQINIFTFAQINKEQDNNDNF